MEVCSLYLDFFVVILYVLLPGCDNEYTGPRGNITSPGYPDNYANNLDCTFRITLDSQIRLTFNDVDIEDHSSCYYDYLKVI